MENFFEAKLLDTQYFAYINLCEICLNATINV